MHIAVTHVQICRGTAFGIILHIKTGIIAKNPAGEVVTTLEGHSYGKDKVEEIIALLSGES